MAIQKQNQLKVIAKLSVPNISTILDVIYSRKLCIALKNHLFWTPGLPKAVLSNHLRGVSVRPSLNISETAH